MMIHAKKLIKQFLFDACREGVWHPKKMMIHAKQMTVFEHKRDRQPAINGDAKTIRNSAKLIIVAILQAC